MYFSLFDLLIYGLIYGIGLFILICIVLKLITKPYPSVIRYKEEEYYVDPTSKEKRKFPSFYDESTIHLSVIVPAYNEEVRLPPMLDECLSFFKTRGPQFRYEIIVVSDGSSDKTVEVAQKYGEKHPENIRVLELVKNRGKGGAVRLGMESARGALLLFADADGATKFSDLVKLEEILKQLLKKSYIEEPELVSQQKAIVIGSRAHLQDDAVATRSIFRTILMYGFHLLVWIFTVKGVKDTQCGFKLLTREAARICFQSMHVERWAFDVELLYIAQQVKIPISEVAVNWTEIEGSKVTPIWSWLQMGRDLFLIWLRYTIGAWKIKPYKKD